MGVEVGSPFFFCHMIFQVADLLSYSQLGFWFSWRGCSRWWRGSVGGRSCIGLDSGRGVLLVTFWAVSSHMTLSSAPEAPAFCSVLSSFFFSSEFLEWEGGCSVYIHQNYSIVSTVGSLGSVGLVGRLISSSAITEPHESRILELPDVIHFFLCCFLPFGHCGWDVFLVYHSAVDIFSKSGAVSCYGSHGI
jgi:hypothetical protein